MKAYTLFILTIGLTFLSYQEIAAQSNEMQLEVIDSLFSVLSTSPNSWKLSAVRTSGVSFKVFISR